MVLPGKPGKPTALSITHDRIALGWTKPIEGAHNIISTSIFFRAASDPSDQWKTHSVKGDPTIHIVTQLCGKSTYCFKVRSDCRDGLGAMSHTSEPITIKMMYSGKPGKPRILEIKENTILLAWTKPDYDAQNVTS